MRREVYFLRPYKTSLLIMYPSLLLNLLLQGDSRKGPQVDPILNHQIFPTPRPHSSSVYTPSSQAYSPTAAPYSPAAAPYSPTAAAYSPTAAAYSPTASPYSPTGGGAAYSPAGLPYSPTTTASPRYPGYGSAASSGGFPGSYFPPEEGKESLPFRKEFVNDIKRA